MGARGGGGSRGGSASGGSIQSVAKSARRAFYSQGVTDYFNGSSSSSAIKAHSDFQKKLDVFKKAWMAKTGEKPAFNDWTGAMNDVANGNIWFD